MYVSLVAISSMCWSPDSQLLCSSGGKVIHLWTNQVALEETLRDLKKQLESATSEAHKVTGTKWQLNHKAVLILVVYLYWHQTNKFYAPVVR